MSSNLSALLALAPISIAAGLAIRWAMQRFADQTQLTRVKGLIIAHLLEFRLFGDDPRLVLRAQLAVAHNSFRLMKLLLLPAALVSFPLFFLFIQLEAIFGHEALTPNHPAVLTAKAPQGGEALQLRSTPAIAIETPPVHATAASEITWRIRPTQPGRTALELTQGTQTWSKSLVAGEGLRYLSARRTRLTPAYLLNATEPPLTGSAAPEWIEIRYPEATIYGLHWTTWFLLLSSAAFLLRLP